jgi:hypothetical protein
MCVLCGMLMLRNQFSLTHNGDVNSPELLFPTQGKCWLGAGRTEEGENNLGEILLSLPGAMFSSTHASLTKVTQTGLFNYVHTQTHTPTNGGLHTHARCTQEHTQRGIQKMEGTQTCAHKDQSNRSGQVTQMMTATHFTCGLSPHPSTEMYAPSVEHPNLYPLHTYSHLQSTGKFNTSFNINPSHLRDHINFPARGRGSTQRQMQIK